MSGRDPHPESVPYEQVGRDSHAPPPPSVLELVLSELLTAVPEVRDALLSAADSLLDAARSVIDAADRVVNQHRADEPDDDPVNGGGSATFAVDLGGTHLHVGVVDADATIAGQDKVPTPPTLDAIVATIAAKVDELRPLRPDAVGLGVGAAGLVDRDGAIHYSPNVPAFRRAPVQERLAAALAMPVVVDNDANAAVLGEHTHGVARGHDDVLLVTLGTGVGGGIMINGAVVRGAHGFGAEIGHFQVDPDGPRCACGERGHWEAVASGTALGALGRTRARAGTAPAVLARAGGDADAIDGKLVGDAAQDGDPDALAMLHEYAGNVAVGLVGLANVLDPSIIVVSGGLVELGDVLLDPIRAAFTGHIEGAGYRPEPPVLAAALGDDAGLVGAAVLARHAR